MVPDDADQLPSAHPTFSAHFTNPIYDPDDDNNDDLPPFGTDEGYDELHDWAQRLEELRNRPTLRYMLGDDADAQIVELRHSNQTDVDDIIIGLGFTLLRFTGQVDTEGRGWVIEALQRQNERGHGFEYAQMLHDIATFNRSDLDATTPDPPRKRKTGSWLAISGSNDDELEAWCRRTARDVASDPVWTTWWSTSGLERLVLTPRPIGPPGQNLTDYHRDKSTLQVLGCSAELSQITLAVLEAEEAGHKPSGSAMHTPQVYDLLAALTCRLLRETGAHLAIAPPPSRLPS